MVQFYSIKHNSVIDDAKSYIRMYGYIRTPVLSTAVIEVYNFYTHVYVEADELVADGSDMDANKFKLALHQYGVFPKECKLVYMKRDKNPKYERVNGKYQEIPFPYIYLSFKSSKQRSNFIYNATKVKRSTNQYPSKYKEFEHINGEHYMKIDNSTYFRLVLQEDKSSPELQFRTRNNVSDVGWMIIDDALPIQSVDSLRVDYAFRCDDPSTIRMDLTNKTPIHPRLMSFDIESYIDSTIFMLSVVINGGTIGTDTSECTKVCFTQGNPSYIPDELQSIYDSIQDGKYVELPEHLALILRSDDKDSDINRYMNYDSYDAKLVLECLRKHMDGYEMVHCKNEVELLISFAESFEKYDPFIVTGYNIVKFDMPAIYNRASKYGILNRMAVMSRNKNAPVLKFSEKRIAKESYDKTTPMMWELEGIVTIDLYSFVKTICKFEYEDNKLKTICKYNLTNIGKDPIEVQTIFDSWTYYLSGDYVKSSAYLGIIAKYCVYDSYVVTLLFDKLKTWMQISSLTQIQNVAVDDSSVTGMMWVIYSLINKECYAQGRVHTYDKSKFKDNGGKKVKYKGASVQQPVKGAHRCVGSGDMKSYYPNTMITYNLCTTTYIANPLSSGVLIEDMLKVHIRVHENCDCEESVTTKKKERVCYDKTYYFLMHPPETVICNIERKLLKERDDIRAYQKIVKKKIDVCKDAAELQALEYEYHLEDSKQLGMKVTCNSAYGALGMGEGLVQAKEVAEAITALCRKNINIIINYVRAKWGWAFVIIYGDTDSIYIAAIIKALELWIDDKPYMYKADKLQRTYQELLSESYDEDSKYLYNADNEPIYDKVAQKEILIRNGEAQHTIDFTKATNAFKGLMKDIMDSGILPKGLVIEYEDKIHDPFIISDAKKKYASRLLMPDNSYSKQLYCKGDITIKKNNANVNRAILKDTYQLIAECYPNEYIYNHFYQYCISMFHSTLPREDYYLSTSVKAESTYKNEVGALKLVRKLRAMGEKILDNDRFQYLFVDPMKFNLGATGANKISAASLMEYPILAKKKRLLPNYYKYVERMESPMGDVFSVIDNNNDSKVIYPKSVKYILNTEHCKFTEWYKAMGVDPDAANYPPCVNDGYICEEHNKYDLTYMMKNGDIKTIYRISDNVCKLITYRNIHHTDYIKKVMISKAKCCFNIRIRVNGMDWIESA